MQPLVTVVIPVYKTEKYLDRCVGSVAGQRYANLEILLIDDGSPDSCPERCDGWAEKDHRIRVIHKANQGLGMARNTGMEFAWGKYVCFVDSDDALEETALEAAVELAEREGAQIVLYGMTCLNAAGAVKSRRIPEKAVFSGREVQDDLLPRLIAGEDGLTMSACCCLISMDLVRRAAWRFPSEREIISEDVYALLGLFKSITKAAVLPAALYRYYENPTSLTHVYRPDRFEKSRQFYRALLSLCDDCGYGAEIRQRCAEPFLSYTIAALKQEAAHRGYKALPRVREILSDDSLQRALRQVRRPESRKRRLLVFCLRKAWGLPTLLLLLAQNRTQ